MEYTRKNDTARKTEKKRKKTKKRESGGPKKSLQRKNHKAIAYIQYSIASPDFKLCVFSFALTA